MTNITSLSQFLNSQTSQSGQSSSMFNSATKTAVKTAPTQTTTADGDTITLSAKAQALLDKNKASKKDYGFTLTAKQQEDLQTVLKRHADKPQTQENYDAIQKDLKKLRLDTPNMGAKESAKSFSIKSIMLSILAGKDVSNGTTERAQALASKKSAYAIQIVADWAVLRTAAEASKTTPETNI